MFSELLRFMLKIWIATTAVVLGFAVVIYCRKNKQQIEKTDDKEDLL
ncbi:MAG: hypothetical protein P4L74_03090 [Candidatus Doudnabacteria bacterium]|nr:hypothetical protein [Candidatus Doudnabacteria bacterium]